MDASELRKLYAAGKRDFSKLNLSGVYWMYADLSEANLSEANLSKANLSEANLCQADLNGANLSGTDLSCTDLSCTDLSGANLYGANLSVANLYGANLRGANLYEANLSGANMIEVSLSGANLYGANLSKASLCEADLIGANLKGVNLKGTNLVAAYLNEANLIGVDLSDTCTYLCAADLSEANLSGAKIAENYLTNPNLERPKIDGTILAYQRISEELQRENQELRGKLSVLENKFENRVERDIQRRLIANQGIKANKLPWEGLRFRSEPEKKVAQVLDEMGILFFPLPSGRVMTEEGMTTREVDFLICSKGIWGILECDGEMWHPSAAKDHKRDNDFKRHGLWFIQRFTDKECKKNPHKVVRQFFDMLHKFHEDQRYLITGNSTERKTAPLQSNLSLQAEYNEDENKVF